MVLEHFDYMRKERLPAGIANTKANSCPQRIVTSSCSIDDLTGRD